MLDPNLLWIPVVLGWFALEFWGLHSSKDREQPFTYWVRHIFHLQGPLREKVHSIGWWIALGLCLWVTFHFVIEAA